MYEKKKEHICIYLYMCLIHPISLCDITTLLLYNSRKKKKKDT